MVQRQIPLELYNTTKNSNITSETVVFISKIIIFLKISRGFEAGIHEALDPSELVQDFWKFLVPVRAGPRVF